MPVITVTRLGGNQRDEQRDFTQNEISLGTGPHSDVPFDPTWDRNVAPTHARIGWKHGVLRVEDASGRGLIVDGQLVQQADLKTGAVIELGRGGPRIRVDFALAAASPAAGGTVSAQLAASSGSRGRLVGLAAVLIVAGAVAAWKFTQPAATDAQTKDPVVSAAPSTSVDASKPPPAAPAAAPALDTDTRIQAASRKVEKCVALVIASTPGKSQPVGTAFAVGPSHFATNAHVVAAVAELMKEQDATVHVVMNRAPESRFLVRGLHVHSRAGEKITSPEGRTPTTLPWDVGILTIEGSVETHLNIAAVDKLKALDSGSRIAYIGFPMEGLQGGGVDASHPVANMQSGIVTSVTDIWLAKADYQNRYLVQHNLGITGGASGSPVFDADGDVVALISSMNVGFTVREVSVPGPPDAKGRRTERSAFVPVRSPSAAMVNFAQRADLVNVVLEEMQKSEK